ncbi:aspartate/glutamate racemase family protein [Hydrogenophaga soli]
MKTIGLIGGMSWESTTMYYQVINREVARRLGGLHSAKFNLISLDFEDIARRQRAGDWSGMSHILSDAAQRLEDTGADCVLIGTNTMHLVAPTVQQSIAVPLLHIAEVTADAIVSQGLRKVGLLGTRFTMEQPFYKERLAARGIDCVVPDEAGRTEVHRIIFEELCKGHFHPAARQALQAICADLAAQGAEGIILGCTELPLILGADDLALPLFDTTTLHALAAVDFALEAPVPWPEGVLPVEAVDTVH